MKLKKLQSAFWILTDLASLYGLTAPKFRKECEKRGIALKGHKEKYSPKEVEGILAALGVPKKMSEVGK
jgi:hypothetical protein